MNTAEKLDQALDEITAGKRSMTPPPVKREPPPLEDLMRQALEFAKNIEPEKAIEHEKLERTPDAERIRSRLPPYCWRKVNAAQLEGRVTDHRLRQRARLWKWGDGGLLMVGETRIGKSSAAAMIFRRLLGAGWREGGQDWARARGLRWYSSATLSLARREHPLGEGEAPDILRASGASLLVLDDIGWDKDPQIVSEVLHKRYEQGAPTILTSGRTVAELSSHYGAAVLRRFGEAGGLSNMLIDCFEPISNGTQDERHP